MLIKPLCVNVIQECLVGFRSQYYACGNAFDTISSNATKHEIGIFSVCVHASKLLSTSMFKVFERAKLTFIRLT